MTKTEDNPMHLKTGLHQAPRCLAQTRRETVQGTPPSKRKHRLVLPRRQFHRPSSAQKGPSIGLPSLPSPFRRGSIGVFHIPPYPQALAGLNARPSRTRAPADA
jgi:hypothetical protein